MRLFRIGVSIGLMFAVCPNAMAFGGTRAIGMGGSYTALADGPEAAFWNPAALAVQGGKGIVTDMSGSDYSVAFSDSNPGKVSGALAWYRDNPITGTGFGRTAFAYSIAASLKGTLDAGLTVRYETVAGGEGLDRLSGRGLGIDLGLLKTISPRIVLGMLVQDATVTRMAWNNGSSESYGVNIRPGFAWKPDSSWTVTGELYNIGAGMLPFAAAEGIEARGGVEKRFTRGGTDGVELALRLGGAKGFLGMEDYLTCGVGLTLPYGNPGSRLSVDYALAKRGSGTTNHLGVGLRF